MITKTILAAALLIQSNFSFHNAEFLRLYDGDSLFVNIPGVHPLLGSNIGIRVNGIDTPEMHGKKPCEKEMARKAKAAALQLVKSDTTIKLTNCGKGKYFRLVCDVTIDEVDLGQHLLERKLAVPYDGGAKPNTNWCSTS